jgi:Xaa-Pro aminopeptidase
MRRDLDDLMTERNLDGFLVMGDSGGNGIFNYLTLGADLENALLAKRRGGPLTLIHGSMERDVAEGIAEAAGLTLVNRDSRYNLYSLLQKHEGDVVAARVDYLAQVIKDNDLHGRLGVYGRVDAGEAYTILDRLNGLIDGEVVGEVGTSLFSLARETKDRHEIAGLAEAGRLTSLTVGDVWEFLRGHQVRNETLVRSDGEALTIGDVKAFIRSRVHHYGMSEDHGCIFAQGRDAGVPHNAGDPAMPMRLGQSIVFDIFPIVPSGYFHDMTRTWSLGYATEEVQEAWTQTKEIFDRIMGSLAVGTPCRDYQIEVCKFYEALGHRTVMSHPGTEEGYVHGLGHGVGLDIHEEPRMSHASGNLTLLQPGHVLSVEPGLYYPERGFGVRIEDTVAFEEDGSVRNLTNFQHDLVISM